MTFFSRKYIDVRNLWDNLSIRNKQAMFDVFEEQDDFFVSVGWNEHRTSFFDFLFYNANYCWYSIQVDKLSPTTIFSTLLNFDGELVKSNFCSEFLNNNSILLDEFNQFDDAEFLGLCFDTSLI